MLRVVCYVLYVVWCLLLFDYGLLFAVCCWLLVDDCVCVMLVVGCRLLDVALCCFICVVCC